MLKGQHVCLGGIASQLLKEVAIYRQTLESQYCVHRTMFHHIETIVIREELFPTFILTLQESPLSTGCSIEIRAMTCPVA